MADMPDLSRIVGMIMENPGLVNEIAAMAKNAEAAPEAPEEPKPQAAPTPRAEGTESERRVHRSRLASAMKPYLSKERARAIDTMMSIADILDMTRGRS